jgi:3-methylfumaryl-CoA hydratase
MSDWQPAAETRDDVVTATAARALHELLDRDGSAPASGDPLPILWHWLAFLPQARQSEIGGDGHPRTGGFLPPTGGRRRMYAGGKASMTGTVRIGEPLQRFSVVSDVTTKTGRSGALLFVTVDHRISGDGAAAGELIERADIVYKDADAAAAVRTAATDIDADALWACEVAIDPTMLFRFSALTYNAHRIHYDREYATGGEGYPGLVVHGPLQAVLLADAAARAFPGRTITGFSFRSVAPAFDAHPLQLRVRQEEDGSIRAAAYSGGVQTMTASVHLEGSR